MSLKSRIRKLEAQVRPQGPPVCRIVLFNQGESEEEKARILAEKKAEILAAGEDLDTGDGGPSIFILDFSKLPDPREQDEPDEEGS